MAKKASDPESTNKHSRSEIMVSLILIFGFLAYFAGDLTGVGKTIHLYTPPMSTTALSTLMGHVVLGGSALFCAIYIPAQSQINDNNSLLSAFWLFALFYEAMDTWIDSGIFPVQQLLMIALAVAALGIWKHRKGAFRFALWTSVFYLAWSSLDFSVHLQTFIYDSGPSPSVIAHAPFRTVTDLFWILILLALLISTYLTRRNQPLLSEEHL